MKKILFNLKLSKVLYLIIVCSNVILPLLDGVYVKPRLFNCIVIIFWTYGLISHMGYFLKKIDEDSEGKITYETNIPMIQVGFTRMIQLGYYFMRKRESVDWSVFAVLVLLDVLYVIFMLVDKSKYYYESEEMSNEN